MRTRLGSVAWFLAGLTVAPAAFAVDSEDAIVSAQQKFSSAAAEVGSVQAAVGKGIPGKRTFEMQIADAQITVNTMAGAAGITLPAEPPLLHFAKRMDVLNWGIRAV